jgi:hypothetical protein
MFKNSVRYFALAFSLVVLSACCGTASAQSTDPCTDPSTGCVVSGTDPIPTGQAVAGSMGDDDVVSGTDPIPTDTLTDDDIDFIVMSYMYYYGLG